MVVMYTHISTWFCWFSWKVVLLVWKPALLWKAHEKQQKQLIDESTGEGQLVVFGGACMCKCTLLTWFCWFSWNVVLFAWKPALSMKSTWKAKKQPIENRSLSFWPGLFHRVQRKGQLGISYILVVFGGVCGACMCKWCMYTHISH